MTLLDYAYTAGRAATTRLSRDEQKNMGQYMTPPAIAKFMARRLAATVADTTVRVLEPAAGAGILAAALVE
jgi:adenine-specific DNA-methyltransferase